MPNKEINPEFSVKEGMSRLKFGTPYVKTQLPKKSIMPGKMEGRRRKG